MLSNFKLRALAKLKRNLPIVFAVRIVNKYIRKIAFLTHRFQYKVEWSIDNPEHYEHYMDLYYQWKKTRNSFPMERGVFSSYALKGMSSNPGNTLDLCCGDGFYAYYFYSLNSSKVTAIDFDPLAIKTARLFHHSNNIEFLQGDIRFDIPKGPFDNVIWDAAIEHFTEEEIGQLMDRIKSVLTPAGILSGYTIKEPEHNGKHLHQHEYEFHNEEDLGRFLSPHFKNVQILTTRFPERTNYYFYASDANLPLAENSTYMVKD